MDLDPFDIEYGSDRTTLVLRGPWTQEVAEAVEVHGVDSLILNYARGFQGQDLRFLQEISSPLRHLNLLARTISDLESIETLGSSLESLDLIAAERAPINLAKLPRLTHLSGFWDQLSPTLDELPHLKNIHLNSFDRLDLNVFSAHVHLEHLSLKDRPRMKSLAGIASLSNLRHLGIHGARDLWDIDELSALRGLQELELPACRKLQRVEANIAKLTHLRFLDLSEGGDLASLSFVEEMSELERLSLHSSTRILDGDLSLLMRLPKLWLVRLQSRKHYRPRVGDIQEYLKSKEPERRTLYC